MAPERRRFPTNVTNYADNGFEYVDASMSDGKGAVRESEPIDDVIDWLKKLNFSCMGTRHVYWDASGTKGTVGDMGLGKGRQALVSIVSSKRKTTPRS